MTNMSRVVSVIVSIKVTTLNMFGEPEIQIKQYVLVHLYQNVVSSQGLRLSHRFTCKVLSATLTEHQVKSD